MIFDTGVIIALQNPSQRRVVLALIKRMQAEGVEPATNEAVLAQAWRDPARQAPVTLLLKATTVHSFGDPKTIGVRCAKTDTTDVVDASVAVLSDQLGTAVLTTDPSDMARLGGRFAEL